MGSPVLKHMSTLSANKEPKDVAPASLVPEGSEVPANELPGFSGNQTAFSEEQEKELKAVMIGNTVNRLRHWCFTDYGIRHQKIPQYGLEFTITSYNILAQELLESNSWLYHHVEPEVLQWEYRSRNLIRELRSLQSDIICLQEVQDDHYESIIKPAFEVLDYECLYKKRTGDRRDGCAVFFRRALFSLVKCKPVEFFKPCVPLCDRDNVALIVLLRPRGLSPHCDVHLCVATTHLLFNPRRGDIKLAQLRLLLAEIDYLAFKKYHSVEKVTEYHPVILCGDMNSEPFSPLYNFISKGSLNCSSLLSGDISGQAAGANRGRILDLTQLLTPCILITESSQFSDILKLRQGLSSLDPNNETPCSEAVTLDPMDSSLWVTGADAPSNDSSSSAASPSTISHSFKFNSVYSHFCGGNHEVTTHHTRANCTVDYIFYTTSNISTCLSDIRTEYRRPEEGPLHILANYRLLNNKEMTKLGGLPNSFQSSDHLSLASRFLLKLF